MGLQAGQKNNPELIISLKLPLNGFYEKNMMQRSLRINSDFAGIGTLENNKIAGKNNSFIHISKIKLIDSLIFFTYNA